jgi:cell division protein ZapA
MTVEIKGTAVNVLGKTYNFKCNDQETHLLEAAANLLETRMQAIKEVNHVLSIDRIAVLAAFGIAHELLATREEKNHYQSQVENKLQHLQHQLIEVNGLVMDG